VPFFELLTNAPLGSKLPLHSGQRCCCDWSGPPSSRDPAHWLALTGIAWRRPVTSTAVTMSAIHPLKRTSERVISTSITLPSFFLCFMSQLAGVVRLLKTEHKRLNRQLQGVSAALSAFGAAYGKPKARRSKMSAAARERIAAAQRLRWSKLKGRSGQTKTVSSVPKRRTISAPGRKRIVAAQKLRWAKIRSAKAAQAYPNFHYQLSARLPIFGGADFSNRLSCFRNGLCTA
jgi:hypothetical protein